MAINYSIAQMKNPNDKGAPAKYYAKAQASGSVDINELAEEISYSIVYIILNPSDCSKKSANASTFCRNSTEGGTAPFP